MKSVKPGTMGVVLNEHSQILMHLRSDHKSWGLPGGSVSFGESFQTTVIREVLEETGIEVRVEKVLGVLSDPSKYIFSYPDGNQVHGFMVAFLCKPIGGVLCPKNEESDDVRWFDTDALPSNIFVNHIKFIRQVLSSNGDLILD